MELRVAKGVAISKEWSGEVLGPKITKGRCSEDHAKNMGMLLFATKRFFTAELPVEGDAL